ncbi:MAG TPA: hypothetical protein VGX24_11885 [Pyrinomonadaceae bacterium]|jgi:hypothetical protein|nr:hypothetical protein [Pyrinomonadaceae bacterium]
MFPNESGEINFRAAPASRAKMAALFFDLDGGDAVVVAAAAAALR